MFNKHQIVNNVNFRLYLVVSPLTSVKLNDSPPVRIATRKEYKNIEASMAIVLPKNPGNVPSLIASGQLSTMNLFSP